MDDVVVAVVVIGVVVVVVIVAVVDSVVTIFYRIKINPQKKSCKYLKKYHIINNPNYLSSRRHMSSKIFPDQLIWGRDRMSLNCHSLRRKLLYNLSLNCRPTGRVIVSDNYHKSSNYNVSTFVADM